MPVTMASQTSMPQSRSPHASVAMAAAWAAVGGCGSGCAAEIGSDSSKGFRPIQPQRTARLPAPFRIAWILSSEPAARGRHLCGLQRWSHT